MPISKPTSALILVGHGSTLNSDSSGPTHRHADEIRRRGIFAEVVCAFWKEEPSMTEVYAMVESGEIYIVPNFISEGYFCQQVLPRELRLSGPTTQRDGRIIHYCEPVGMHPNMTRLLLKRADEVAAGVPRAQTSLIIVGHGTNLNENSAKAIQAQVKLIREGGHGFAEVLDAYMDEAPFIADWQTAAAAPNVVVAPFFISDGLHSFQEIPVMLGIEAEPGVAASEREIFRRNPHPIGGRHLYYSSAIGTEPDMADVILDQVEEFDRQHGMARDFAGERVAVKGGIVSALDRWLKEGRDIIGELRIERCADDRFRLHHILDPDRADPLQRFTSPLDAQEIAKYDDQGRFRPLKTAPTLRRGWVLELGSIEELRLALDFFYPASLGKLLAHERGILRPVPLRDLLGRQTGMYRFTNTITDDQALDMIAHTCDTATHCLRRILWGLTAEKPLTGPAAAKCQPGETARALPLLCMEACTHIVSAARKIARGDGHDAPMPGD